MKKIHLLSGESIYEGAEYLADYSLESGLNYSIISSMNYLDLNKIIFEKKKSVKKTPLIFRHSPLLPLGLTEIGVSSSK